MIILSSFMQKVNKFYVNHRAFDIGDGRFTMTRSKIP